MRGLLNRLQVGVFRATPEGRLQESNPAFRRLLGLSASELRRRVTLPELFADPRDAERILARLREEGGGVQEEVRWRRADGSALWVALTMARTEGDGGRPALEGLIEDVTPRRAAEAALRESHAELRALAAHLQTVREEERARLAAQVHDELAQPLSALKLALAWLGRRLRPRTGEPRVRLREMAALLDGAIGTARRISTELRPTLLDDLGLGAAIEWQVRQFAERNGIEATLALDPGVEPGKEVAITLFRILQDLLGNVRRHAGARRVEVSLAREGGALVLAVRDDGRGLSSARRAEAAAFGWLAARERALRWGGTVDLERASGRGTTAVVRIPVDG